MNTSAPTRKQSWKDNVQKTRFVMDILLLVSFLIVLAPQSTGIVLHEWLSLVFFVPFVIHILLHWQWFTHSFKQFNDKCCSFSCTCLSKYKNISWITKNFSKKKNSYKQKPFMFQRASGSLTRRPSTSSTRSTRRG